MVSKKKVLCVDDEPINLFIMEKFLGKKFDIMTASGGVQALALLKNTPDIELVVSDMHMPGMNGLAFIQEAQKRFSNKQYFMLSGYAITEEIQNALDTRLICAYFEKPANFQKIERALEES